MEFYFKSSPEATAAAARAVDSAGKKEFGGEYKNLKVQEVLEPTVLLKSINLPTDLKRRNSAGRERMLKEVQDGNMQIEFIKVNPTKYRIKVTGARKPYTLVFSESFHKGWKLYLKGAPSSKRQIPNKFQASNFKFQKLGEWVMGKIGKAASEITGLFLRDKGYGKEVASYFDGEIKEGTHRMTFLEPATFETWGKKPIAEGRHYLVNGYANSWYIKPSDTGGRENYELIVEFWPQRLFYIGLFISLTTLAGCLGYLGYQFTIKRTKGLKN